MTKLTKKQAKTTLSYLKRVRKFLKKPERWAQGALARNNAGYTVDAVSADATCFCMLGALDHVRNGADYDTYNAVCAVIVGAVPRRFGDIISFNDDEKTKHKDVLKVLDRAVRKVEKKLEKVS